MSTCAVCLKKTTPLKCDSCGEPSCKKCSCYVDEDSFEMFDLLPDSIRGKMYCPQCFDQSVSTVLENYRGILDRAKDVNVYSKEQSSETRLIRRIEKPLKVKDCGDREETLMRLAFMAAQMGCDTLVDTQIKSEKLNPSGYKKLVWSGTAVPVKS